MPIIRFGTAIEHDSTLHGSSMFLQIKLKCQDQNSHRFLLRDLHTQKTGNLFTFLSIATVQKHAKEHEKDHPTAAKGVTTCMSTMHSLVPWKMTVQ